MERMQLGAAQKGAYMVNIELDSNDRLGRRIVLLTSGAMYIVEKDEKTPEPFVTVKGFDACRILNDYAECGQ